MRTNPIIQFDEETTSVDVATAKIVQLAARKYDRELNPISELKVYLFNPGVPIPKEASDIHGITDEMVANEPTFAQRAKEIHDFFKGCDVAGHNVERFDVPLLAEEFERCGIIWPEPDMQIYDTYVVFRDKEPRDLTAALKFYCDEEMQGAHDAGNDVTAADKILKGQMKRYPELDLEAIHKMVQGDKKKLDLAGKIAEDAEGFPIYTFGKGKDKRLKDDPGFGHWMLKQDFITSNTKRIVRAIVGDPPAAQPYNKWKR